MSKLKKTFHSTKFDEKSLQDVLWETLTKVQKDKIDTKQAAVLVSAAREICNVAKLSLQRELLNEEIQRSNFLNRKTLSSD